MPFTFCHPALVLPLPSLSGRRLSLTGLAVGSMAPDFEYFIRMKPLGHIGHTFCGIFYFDLPLSLLVAFVFHSAVRNPLIEQLPEKIRTRLVAFTHFDWNRYAWRQWPWVIVSVLLGAVSHLVWDAFTHKTGFFVGAIGFLSEHLCLFGRFVPVYNLLQHSSSVLGAIVIYRWFSYLPKTESPRSAVDPGYWITLGGVGIAVVLVRLISGLSLDDYGGIIVSTISAAAIGIFCASLRSIWIR
ncbi:DUF4184 family protein [Flavobacterium sp. HJ-32-4]|uniref:DUF4184 family protein n=2 Tax=unclassified Flavobacterium TaxID=196869 RepID=UPI0035301595